MAKSWRRLQRCEISADPEPPIHFHHDHHHHSSPKGNPPPVNPNFSAEEEMKAGESTQWFGYIAVGITLVSMTAGLALVGWVVYLFFRTMR